VEANRFEQHYTEWREKRIAKIEKIFGTDYFKNKNILEVGCGYGQIGKHFRGLGADVEFTEGREEHLPFIKENNPGCAVYHTNHDEPWNLNKKYDVLIHFGLLYHLTNWQQDLQCAFKHADIVILETEILDSLKEDGHYNARDGGGYDQALPTSYYAVRPSALFVEKVIRENGFSFTRYDDQDLECTYHTYVWKETGKHDELGGYFPGSIATRRFWVCKKNV
jgi:SAM-dependent methyltransferase